MRTKKKETYRNADDIDMVIRRTKVEHARAKHEMLAAKAEADRCRDIINAIGRENLSEQLAARYHTHYNKMVAMRKEEDTKARRMYRIELKLNQLKQISGVVKTEAFPFLEDKAVTA